MNQLQLNRYLDHAVLKPELSQHEAREAIQLGIDYKVRTVCVRPCDIDMAVEMCKGTETEVSCVLGFPHGDGLSEIKEQEAIVYIKKHVKEIDMVVNYGHIKSRRWDLVEQDIKGVSNITRPSNVLLKVIFETSMLSVEEIKKATEISISANADFVKTSTGFNGGGATDEAVQAMVEAAEGRIMVKASGGIREAQKARKFIEMGCQRLGANYSSTPAICNGEVLNTDIGGSY